MSLTENEVFAWGVAHGLPRPSPTDVPWTRAVLLEALPNHEYSFGLDRTLDVLIGKGLLAEIDPQSEAAVDFARRHNIFPTLMGLGNSAEHPESWGIGLPGAPIVEVTGPLFLMWHQAHLDDNLWAACSRFGDSDLADGSEDGRGTEPRAILAALLDGLRPLLTVNAVRIDITHGAT
ncbi:hypothetical protein GCM10022225_63970 [Plantactinospora mayteni]|uniref:Uncharacterized protein n=1 Tax=Plantactinospora mayteni TaxID=566021 RepID=A0ABQ4F088_9ACTN|nr:hypothetical protein Pma05_68980 [Plantactinospora mayteni]